MPASTRRRGLLYDDAARFARDLEAKDHAASLQMLAAWSESYWGARQRLDTFLAKVEAARAAGEAPGVSWAYQERRLRNVLDSTATEMARYAQTASSITETRQRQAVQEGLAHAESLTTTVVAEGLPGLTGELARTNPDVLNQAVGFLQDGSVLREHLAATMPGDAADAVKSALVKGLAGGKSVDWMTREATRALGLSHGRAVTIMRTESLRAYRSASRAVYQANADVVGTWTWNAHLDARTCVACTLMDGTEHPLSATLDGHPRCRCAMVPRTRSWADLGVEGLDDTRPPVRQGREWLEDQSPEVQKAILGKAKFQAWQDGTISLDDMVARHDDPRWGTMRTERSLKAIQENRNANWMDDPGPQDLSPPPLQGAPTDTVTTTGAGTKADPWVASVPPDVFKRTVKPTQHLPSQAEAMELGITTENDWDAFLAYMTHPGNVAKPKERVDYWRAQIRAGADVPPVRVTPGFGPNALANMQDGHHRAAAFLLEGKPIPVRQASGEALDDLLPQVAPPSPARTNPFTGTDLSDALSPTRKRTAAAIRKELEQTQAGKDLADAIKAFTETRGGVANLRKNITATLDGTASDAVKAKAQAFMDALDAYPTEEVPELFRGMAVKVEANTAEWWDAFEGQFAPGSTFDLNASSFTSSEKKAAQFSGMIGGTKRATSNYTAVRFYLEEGAHALPVERLSKFGAAEKEWITGGRFEVTDFSPATPGQPYARVVIRQVSGLG